MVIPNDKKNPNLSFEFFAIFNPATNMPENLQEDLNDLCEDNRGFEKLYDTYTKRGLAVPQIEMTFWGIYGS